MESISGVSVVLVLGAEARPAKGRSSVQNAHVFTSRSYISFNHQPIRWASAQTSGSKGVNRLRSPLPHRRLIPAYLHGRKVFTSDAAARGRGDDGLHRRDAVGAGRSEGISCHSYSSSNGLACFRMWGARRGYPSGALDIKIPLVNSGKSDRRPPSYVALHSTR